MPLSLNQCKLATQQLVDKHNQTEGGFAELQQFLPHLWGAADIAAQRNHFVHLNNVLRRSAYRVGFVGRSQVGKSSTVNRLLRVADAEGPCSPGQGIAATSATTCIRIRPGESKHTCTLKYFSTDQFKDFRQLICARLGLDYQKSNSEIIGELDALIKRYEEDQKAFQSDNDTQAVRNTAMDARQSDREFFRRFLDAYEAFHRDYIRTESLERPGNFESRREYTNHPRVGKVSPHLLLVEVVIDFVTDAVDPRLEIIDLPGLGAGAVDRIRTESFLPSLDAALIFQSTEHVKSNEAFEMMEELRKNFGRLKHRAWMVITKFDNVARHALLGEDNQPTILDNIADALRENFVPQDQVMFVANEFHRLYLERNGQISADVFETTLKLKVDEAGKPVVPSALEMHKPLRAAYAEVVKDGGIKNLRDAIGTRLADEIQSEVRAAIQLEFQQIGQAVAKSLEYDEERSRMNDADFTCASRWENQVHRLVKEIDANRAMLEKPSHKLVQVLRDKFVELFPANIEPRRERLPERHHSCMVFLKQFASGSFRTDLVPTFQRNVRATLEAFAQRERIPTLRLQHHASPVEDLAARLGRIMEQSAWYEKEFESLDTDALFPPPGSAAPPPDLTYPEYRAVVAHKIDAVVHRVVHLFARRLKDHLAELEQALASLANRNAQAPPAQTRQAHVKPIQLFQEIANQW